MSGGAVVAPAAPDAGAAPDARRRSSDTGGGHAATIVGKDPAAAPLQPGESPFARQSGGWHKARQAVLNNVALSQAFNTLRDMTDAGEYIRPEQLQTIKVLGEGAFATVDKAMYTPMGGGEPYVVAVKRLKLEMFRNQEDIDLFVQEIELMRKLRHRNIVDFVGAGEIKPGQIEGASACEFVVQEFMAGGTLKQLVTREMLSNGRRTYTNQQALDICLQMARGLRYLHRARPMVIHRDLKLENVLLKSSTPVDGSFLVKLADFGLSRRVQVKQQAITLRKRGSSNTRSLPAALPSKAGMSKASSVQSDALESAWTNKVQHSFVASRPPSMISLAVVGSAPAGTGAPRTQAQPGQVFQLTGRTGSLMYMAPEVFNEQPYSEKADVFSFAVMVYEVMQRYIMLSAVAVRGTYDELEAYCARVAGGYRPPLHKNWPDSVTRLIQDCWAQDPAARPSMEQVVTRLEEIQASGDMEAMDKQTGCSCVIC